MIIDTLAQAAATGSWPAALVLVAFAAATAFCVWCVIEFFRGL